MKLADLFPLINLPDLIAQEWGGEAVRGLIRERGGVICDPRPGHSETRASFSVYRRGDLWRWKRHGGDEGSGTAYGFLLECGYTHRQAREELHRLAGVPLDGGPVTVRPRMVYTPPSAIEQARRTLTGISPLNAAEQARVVSLLAPLTDGDGAAQDLQRRGLWGYSGLQAARLRHDFSSREGRLIAHAGALGFLLRNPDGRTAGLKLRNLGSADELQAAGLCRYVYRISGHGAPAWCSPEYGQGQALLIVEGELSGAAAACGLSAAGLALDVQGLAGAGGVPYLEGMAERVVYLYADPDPAGAACIERVGRIATQAGAAEVRVLAPLEDGDFCDELGRLGAAAFGEQLQERLKGAELVQPDIRCKTGLHQIEAAPSAGKGDLVQWCSVSQGWVAPDGGWGIDRGGW
ncbi:hypothetical protein [Deinococcus sp.]|uniref:hypothetical protein n=1 Tax=Deinococcus sp. TaxID=47478 RepID=UPI003CC59FB9